MRLLCRSASVITPNLTEASFLLGVPTPASLTRAEAVDMLEALHELTPGNAVITSAALSDFPDSICTIARDEEGPFVVICKGSRLASRIVGGRKAAGDRAFTERSTCGAFFGNKPIETLERPKRAFQCGARGAAGFPHCRRPQSGWRSSV